MKNFNTKSSDSSNIQVNKLIGLNVLGAVLSLIFFILQAELFGASREIEVYFMTLGFVHIVLALLQATHIGPLFLPIYHQIQKSTNKVKGFEAFSVVLNWMCIITIPLLVIVYLSSGWLLDLGWMGYAEQDKQVLTVMIKVMMPTVLLQMLNFVIEIFHAANEKYGRSESMVALSTAISIGSLVIWFEDAGVWALVIGWWMGCLIRFLTNVFFLYQMNFKFYFYLKSDVFDHKEFFSQVSSSYLYSGSRQMYNIVFLGLVTYLPEGVYAIYKYVENLFQRIQRVITDPINTVFYTNYSQALHSTVQEAKKILKWSLARGLMQASMVLIFLIPFRQDILTFLWSENFGLDNILLGTTFLLLFAITLIPYSIGSLFQKTILALGKAKSLYSLLGAIELINTFFIYIALKYFEIEGLVAAILVTTLIQNMSVFFLLLYHKKNPFSEIKIREILIYFMVVTGVLIIGLSLNQYINIELFETIDRLGPMVNLVVKSMALTIVLFITYIFLKSQLRKSNVFNIL